MKKFLRHIMVLGIALFSLILNSRVSASSQSYQHIALSGTVNPVIAAHIVDSISEAAENRASFILLTVDTPGGLIISMREIIKSILSSKVPVVVYTYPKGAQAASAGGFIMLSGDINAMAPGTEIGAMHPVSPGLRFYEDSKDTARESDLREKNVMGMKVLNDTVAYGKSIAEKRGRNSQWVEDAIINAKSSTYSEAKAAGVVDLIAEDIPDLFQKLDGRSITHNGDEFTFNTQNIVKIERKMDVFDAFLNFFADPQIIFLLFIIAALGIGYEIKSPGMIIPGAVGGVSLILFLMVIKVLPVNIMGMALIALAIALWIAELFIASYGLLTLGGLVAFVSGSLILFDNPIGGFQVSIWTIAVSVVFVLGFIFVVLRAVLAIHKTPPATGLASLVGLEGVCIEPINLRGKVMVHGEIWSAKADEAIEKGREICVTKADPLLLTVKQKEEIKENQGE